MEAFFDQSNPVCISKIRILPFGTLFLTVDYKKISHGMLIVAKCCQLYPTKLEGLCDKLYRRTWLTILAVVDG